MSIFSIAALRLALPVRI